MVKAIGLDMTEKDSGTVLLRPQTGAIADNNEAPATPARPPVEEVIGKSIADFKAEWQPRLLETHTRFMESLDAEAAATWVHGAAYIRVSCARSLVNDSPDTQLQHTLNLLAQQQVHVSQENIFFDVHTGADYGRRAALQEMLAIAQRGGIKAIGVYLNERLFRNLEQAIKTKREFRLNGVELYYLGSYVGDQRNPVAWQQQVIGDFTAELHARTTSYYVGNHLEKLSRSGRPVGQIPEAYEHDEREASFMGRPGKVKSWRLVQPLAGIINEGCRRYLAGSTLAEVAVWAATTELKGLTPAGRVMDAQWWHQTLRNPRYAGYQAPSAYSGYRPGIESPANRRITRATELVPCILPALWTLADYHAIHDMLRSRYLGPRNRKTYHKYLLSGIAYDVSCQHKMQMKGLADNGTFLMRCCKRAVGGYHSKNMRGDIAQKELDGLLGGLSFTDPELIAHIERELRALEKDEQRERERFTPNPEIGALRQAIASLSHTSQTDVSANLETRVAELVAADEVRRDELSTPLVSFRRALKQLDEWDEAWRSGDIAAKNRILRAAGVRVTVGRPDGDAKAKPCILEIRAENVAFQLALAAACSKSAEEWASVGGRVLKPTNAYIRLSIAAELAGVAAGALSDERGSFVALERPAVQATSSLPGGPWLTIAQIADRLGITAAGVHHRIRRGLIEAEVVSVGNRERRLVRADYFESLASTPGIVRPSHEEGGRWMSVPEFARAVGMTPAGISYRIRQGHLPAMRLVRGEQTGSWIISSQHIAEELALAEPGRKGRPRIGRAAASRQQEKAA